MTNKPATPLPWIVNQRKHVCAAAAGFADVATTANGSKTQVAVDDAAYIVAACNAFPRLVEALRHFVTTSQNVDMPVRSFDALNVSAALSLLRELGE